MQDRLKSHVRVDGSGEVRRRAIRQCPAKKAEEDRETALAFLSDYIVMRKAFLDKAWIEQIPVQRAAFYMDVEIYDTIYVFRGEPLPALPDVNIDFATFLGWTLADGSTPDLSAPVYTDLSSSASLAIYCASQRTRSIAADAAVVSASSGRTSSAITCR